MKFASLLLAMTICLFPTVPRADEITIEGVPPVVVKTIPEAGTEEVDPQTADVKVTFSKEMRDGGWSWATASKDSFSPIAGKIKYLADKRTCVLPVRLQAGKTYAIWLNTQKFSNFKDAQGRPAVPYLLVFKTRS